MAADNFRRLMLMTNPLASNFPHAQPAYHGSDAAEMVGYVSELAELVEEILVQHVPVLVGHVSEHVLDATLLHDLPSMHHYLIKWKKSCDGKCASHHQTISDTARILNKAHC